MASMTGMTETQGDRCGQCGRVLVDDECPDLRCAWWTDGTDPDGDGVGRDDTYDDGTDQLLVESAVRMELAGVGVDVFGTVRLPGGDIVGAAVVGQRVVGMRLKADGSRSAAWFATASEAAAWMDAQRTLGGL